MDVATYESILGLLRATPATAFPYLSQIAARHGTSVSTVYSIYSQDMQYQVMRTHRAFLDASKSLLRMYLLNQITVVEICNNWRLPPCLVLRRFFESCSLLTGRRQSASSVASSASSSSDGAPKRAINAVFKDPSTLASHSVQDAVNVLARELELEELTRLYGSQQELVDKLTKDVEDAVMIDCIMGPESDVARRVAGLEYEGKLYEHLKEHDIAFWTEDELRDLNYIKTPDALLKVPIAVRGRVVMWIDSKATFADAKAHHKLLRDQYSGYINRFGPGAVIYWHSFLGEGVTDAARDVVVLEAFPAPTDVLQLLRL